MRFAYVLDDEPHISAIVCQMLGANGFATRQFSAPAPFMARVQTVPPELIVLDLALGQSDAVEVMRHLKAQLYKGKILLMSGRDASVLSEIQQIGQQHGLAMLPPLQKPFRASDLKERLGATAEASNTPRETKNVKRVNVDLGQVMKNGWLELWYQPKIDLKSLAVCGAEALLRARHPSHGILTPDSLLPRAGDALYQPLTKFVIAQAMTDWKFFADQKIIVKLAINVPASVILAPNFVNIMRQSLTNDSRFPGLIIEVTEDDIIRDAELIREVATQLKLYNIAISIDDFGSAYSSLGRLRDLPFVELKLDRSFVSNCASDRLKHGLCQTVVDLARRLGVSVCAEGVETAHDLQELIAMGFDTVQGFLFSEPKPVKEFATLMLNKIENGSQPLALSANASSDGASLKQTA